MNESEKPVSNGLLQQVTVGVLVGLIVAMLVKEK